MTKKEFVEKEAARIAEDLAIDFEDEEFSLEDFTRGLNVELEHGSRDPQTNVTNDDPIMTGKIALAHLKEMADYYTRLAEMEKEGEESGEDESDEDEIEGDEDSDEAPDLEVEEEEEEKEKEEEF